MATDTLLMADNVRAKTGQDKFDTIVEKDNIEVNWDMSACLLLSQLFHGPFLET